MIPLGAPLTSGSLLIYPSVLAMAGCYVGRRVRASSLKVVVGIGSRRSLKEPRSGMIFRVSSVVVGIGSRRSLRLVPLTGMSFALQIASMFRFWELWSGRALDLVDNQAAGDHRRDGDSDCDHAES